MKWGTEHPERHDLSTLRLLGTVGEPINPEAWIWYHEHIGRRPLPDRGHLVADRDRRDHDHPAAGRGDHQARLGHHPVSRASCPSWWTPRASGSRGGGGFLTHRPSPGRACCAPSIGDDERYREIYWSRFPGRYFTGDGAKLDEDGYWWILGRVDDVLNVAGHRIGTMEVESALVDHPAVAEAAVVGRAHELKGQALAAFVTLKDGSQPRPRSRTTSRRT